MTNPLNAQLSESVVVAALAVVAGVESLYAFCQFSTTAGSIVPDQSRRGRRRRGLCSPRAC